MRDKLLLKDGKVQPKLSQKFQPYLNLDDAEVIKSNRCAFDRYPLHAHTLSDDIGLKEERYLWVIFYQPRAAWSKDG